MRIATRWILAAALLLPASARAEPIKLKLSFFSSDRSVAYQAAVKPFVDAVNQDGKDLVQIEVYFSSTLGRFQNELPQLVLDGTADIAFIVPADNPERFTDNAVVELPGLFRNVREATLTYSGLVAAGALAGYQDFFVIGTYATEPEVINSRKPTSSLAALAGQKLRVNNSTQAHTLAKLGAQAQVLPYNETASALSAGTLDGATAPPGQLFDVGIGRLTSHHYFLSPGAVSLALLMNRNVFDRLPKDARNIIRKYSGAWAQQRFIAAYEIANAAAVKQMRADSQRHVVFPTPTDTKAARGIFQSVTETWAARSAHNRELLILAEADLGKIRAADGAKSRAPAPKD